MLLSLHKQRHHLTRCGVRTENGMVVIAPCGENLPDSRVPCLKLTGGKPLSSDSFYYIQALWLFEKILKERAYAHFLTLTVAISILLDSSAERRKRYIQYARDLLVHFVQKSEEIW